MKREIDSVKEDGFKLILAKPLWRWLGFVLTLVGVLLLFLWLVFGATPWLTKQPLLYRLATDSSAVMAAMPGSQELTADIGRLQKKMDRLTPGGMYLIVNTTNNTFELYRNKKLIRQGLCSTGSYIRLETDQQKHWVFETPKGVLSVKGKITDPVWRKPDWAFVEEGLPVPPADSPSRYEYGVLGDYALALGNGYLIHGTLYQRFLGQPVTHGCIRLNDEDLEAVYKTLPVGAKVFIY
ncbi:L,D-transpeptidase [Mangrovibacterium marinum]|uniref:L,D-transpeptidase-like protein n=1 Tax=Mangrovibacterium marinum TaxID=1639118 RepID=A0A2T5C2E4_9BACT|nr:L,D-transpeptidase [Mangrovibacterium marinum]PTN08821.1 L,D-transpeptidase-like protein [Mangrovibacterium marinum]